MTLKSTLAALALATATLSGCATSFTEVSHYGGETYTLQVRATPERWETVINGEIAAVGPLFSTNTEIAMTGSYRGKQILTRVYYRSNGWTMHKVADVFMDGVLIETLVLT